MNFDEMFGIPPDYSLLNISPIDGRYKNKTIQLKDYFSEYALFKYRCYIEIKYLIELGKLEIIEINEIDKKHINKIYNDFCIDNALKIKEIEKTTNHDIKALEYYIRQELDDKLVNKNILNFVHFGLTSQDINSSSYALSIKNFNTNKLIPLLNEVLENIKVKSRESCQTVILAKTHGQPASPTNMGKELNVFYERLNLQIEKLKNIEYTTKFGGATGNLNAHKFCYPNIDWVSFSNKFINLLGLVRNQTTTQIDHYDNYSEVFDILKRINVILIDFCQDIWLYISNNYFKLKIKKNEVGSSAMPHKVNPINFENAEGNLYLSNAILQLFTQKLPISRLQRDLTDSTILRNIGSAYSYMYIALLSISEGINKLDLNTKVIEKDLNDNYLVVAEAIQSKLKTLNIPNSYEKIKEITRNYDSILQLKEKIKTFINSLDIEQQNKDLLINLSSSNYVGYY